MSDVEWIKDKLDGIQGWVESVDGRLKTLLEEKCPERHRALEHRITSVEVRIYMVVTFVMAVWTYWMKTRPSG
jgi:hypothetical protein